MCPGYSRGPGGSCVSTLSVQHPPDEWGETEDKSHARLPCSISEQCPRVSGTCSQQTYLEHSDFMRVCLLKERLVSAADGLLTVTLTPFLSGLCSQLALQSSLLTQSTTSLREQVSPLS